MSLRTPKSVAKLVNPQTGLSMVEAEMLAESATSLGHHGKKAEAALERLRRSTPRDREALLRATAKATWEFFIQRELCGMLDHRLIIREMGIPQTVLNMMGAADPSAKG